MNGIPERSNPLDPVGPELDGGTDGRRPRLPGSTLRGWFNEAELGRCPRCATNSLVTVNGQVSRSNGKNTVWINGVPQETSRKPADPARVTVPGGESEPSINLKIGQSFDRARGQLKDPAQDGNVSAPPVRDRGER